MYGPKMTKTEMQEALGLKGRALSTFLRQETSAGRMVRRMVFRDPVKGGGRQAVYQSIPQNLELDLSTHEGK